MTKQFTKGEFLPLPDGDYLMRMQLETKKGEPAIKEVETSKKNGKMVKCSFQIMSGDHKGRLIFDQFLVEHENPKAAEIGNDRLSNYLKAVGVEGGLEGIGHDRTQLEDYAEMPFIGTLKTEEAREYTATDGTTKTAKAKNKVTAFKAR